MRLLNHRTTYSILFYILSVILVMLAKPPIMFDAYGNIKQFGVGTDNHTIISLGVVNGVIAIFSFYVFTIVDVIFGSKNSVLV